MYAAPRRSAYLTQLQLTPQSTPAILAGPAAAAGGQQHNAAGPTTLLAELQLQLQQQQQQQQQIQTLQAFQALQHQHQQQQATAAAAGPAVASQQVCGRDPVVQIVLSSPLHVWQPGGGGVTMGPPSLPEAAPGTSPPSNSGGGALTPSPAPPPAPPQLKLDAAAASPPAARTPVASTAVQPLVSSLIQNGNFGNQVAAGELPLHLPGLPHTGCQRTKRGSKAMLHDSCGFCFRGSRKQKRRPQIAFSSNQ